MFTDEKLKKGICTLLLLMDGALLAVAAMGWLEWVAEDTGEEVRMKLLIALGAAVLALIVLYFFCVLKWERYRLFEVLSLACLFAGNTLGLVGKGFQVACVLLLLLLEGLNGLPEGGTGRRMIVLVAVLVAVAAAPLTVPRLSKIEKPKLYAAAEGYWFSLFDTPDPEDVQLIAPEMSATHQEGVLLGNVITNDPFPYESTTPVFTLTSTYPLPYLQIFACGDYDPETDSFALEKTPEELLEKPDPSAAYGRSALGKADAGYPEYAGVLDRCSYLSQVFYPTCAFAFEDAVLESYSDRFFYAPFQLQKSEYRFSFDPNSPYLYGVAAYEAYVADHDLRVPDALKAGLLAFLQGHGIDGNEADKAKLIHQIRTVLSDEYRFTYEPGALPEETDPILYFLLESKCGYSKHFAAAETLLYRMCGIPARYVYGYNVPAYEDQTADVVEADAYAYCQVFAQGTWVMAEAVTDFTKESTAGNYGPNRTSEVHETEGSYVLPNGYDISHLRDTRSMLGPYTEAHSTVSVARQSLNTEEPYVALIVETTELVPYLKAFSAGTYTEEQGTFAIEEETVKSEWDSLYRAEEGPSSGEIASLSVFNLHAGNWIYVPYGRLQSAILSLYGDRYWSPLQSVQYAAHTVRYQKEAPGINSAYTQYVAETYLDVPAGMQKELRSFLRKNGIRFRSRDKGELYQQVCNLLRTAYTYSTEIDEIPASKDPVRTFLLETKTGYCQHFAAAGTLLLRSCGIAARYTVGYRGPFPAETVSEVSSLQAHAWVEVFTEDGWVPVEVTEEQAVHNFPNLLQGKRMRVLAKAGALAVCLIALTVCVIVILRKRNRDWQDLLQERMNLSYLLLENYFYVDDATLERMTRARYSRAGATAEDAAALEAQVREMRAVLRCNRHYLRWLATLRYANRYKRRALKAVK